MSTGDSGHCGAAGADETTADLDDCAASAPIPYEVVQYRRLLPPGPFGNQHVTTWPPGMLMTEAQAEVAAVDGEVWEELTAGRWSPVGVGAVTTTAEPTREQAKAEFELVLLASRQSAWRDLDITPAQWAEAAVERLWGPAAPALGN